MGPICAQTLHCLASLKATIGYAAAPRAISTLRGPHCAVCLLRPKRARKEDWKAFSGEIRMNFSKSVGSERTLLKAALSQILDTYLLRAAQSMHFSRRWRQTSGLEHKAKVWRILRRRPFMTRSTFRLQDSFRHSSGSAPSLR